MHISVIICSHNPRPEYLQRALQALRSQTLPAENWELLIIDNASREPLQGRFDITWHPRARIIPETTLGKVHACRCGIAAAAGDILVFNDDDNLLADNYLEQTLRIAAEHPELGSWGGSVVPEYEKQPEPWMKPWLLYLAIRPVTQQVLSTVPFTFEATPFGAGLCVRSGVARRYSEAISHDSLRLNLDRKGKGLMGAGDLDLATTACDMGLGMGLFPELNLVHIIQAFRLQKKYLHAIYEASAASLILLRYVRGEPITILPEPTLLQKLAWRARLWRMSPNKRALFAAESVGYWKAIEIMRAENGGKTGEVRRKNLQQL